MDDQTVTLIGRHSYCTQEMVNLMLVGRCVSNVFNNELKCDSIVLRGIAAQSQIGLLSLFEHYNSITVGSNYKSPSKPIWLVCSESHFSILFSKEANISRGSQFDLHYYDGLAGQDDEIKLTITLNENIFSRFDDSKAAISPIECVIRTKWKSALIDWNGMQPIL